MYLCKFSSNPPTGSEDRAQKRLIFTVFLGGDLERAWFRKGQNRPCYKNGLFLDMLLNGVFK